MSSSTAAWSSTTLFVSGSFLLAATSDSRRSTRKMMSVARPSLAADYTRGPPSGPCVRRRDSARATAAGTMGAMSPPKRATSFVSELLT